MPPLLLKQAERVCRAALLQRKSQASGVGRSCGRLRVCPAIAAYRHHRDRDDRRAIGRSRRDLSRWFGLLWRLARRQALTRRAHALRGLYIRNVDAASLHERTPPRDLKRRCCHFARDDRILDRHRQLARSAIFPRTSAARLIRIRRSPTGSLLCWRIRMSRLLCASGTARAAVAIQSPHSVLIMTGEAGHYPSHDK
jgi:hypothetical protein